MARKEDYYRRYAEKKADREKRRSESWKVRFKDPLIVFTGILALSTIALTYVACLQNSTLDKTDKTLRDTLAANNAYNRAFIYFRDLTPGQTVQSDGSTEWTFLINLQNAGNTAAKNVRTAFGCEKSKIQSLYTERAAPTVTRIFGPRQSVGSGGCKWKSTDLDQDRLSNTSVPIGGIVKYDDIFGVNHITKWCREILSLADPGRKGIPLEYNTIFCSDLPDCADNECTEKN